MSKLFSRELTQTKDALRWAGYCNDTTLKRLLNEKANLNCVGSGANKSSFLSL